MGLVLDLPVVPNSDLDEYLKELSTDLTPEELLMVTIDWEIKGTRLQLTRMTRLDQIPCPCDGTINEPVVHSDGDSIFVAISGEDLTLVNHWIIEVQEVRFNDSAISATNDEILGWIKHLRE